MTTLTTFPVARKQHRCGAIRGWSDCLRTIAPGVRYCRSALTPHDGDVGNLGWWTMRLCPPCATYYGHPIPQLTEELACTPS